MWHPFQIKLKIPPSSDQCKNDLRALNVYKFIFMVFTTEQKKQQLKSHQSWLFFLVNSEIIFSLISLTMGATLDSWVCTEFCLFCCFTSQINSYGHGGTVSSPNHTFSWASLNKQLTSTSCPYFSLVTEKTLLEWFLKREENDRRNYFMINLHTTRPGLGSAERLQQSGGLNIGFESSCWFHWNTLTKCLYSKCLFRNKLLFQEVFNV